MEFFNVSILALIFEIIIFLVLTFVLEFIYKRIKSNPPRFLNPTEYFPEEEVHTLKQTFYLIMMALLFINVLYSVVFVESDIFYLTIYDIALSLYLAVKLDKKPNSHKILLILLIPYGSLTYLITGTTLVGIVDFIHIPVFIYFIKVYFDKFREYTESNGLGIAIILLFTIIFFSFLWTQIFENVNALDSLVMVSNAFTSNGYAILGTTIPGKLNAVLLVWGGYILSGVGTATLTAGILMKHFNSRFEKLEKLIEENKKE